MDFDQSYVEQHYRPTVEAHAAFYFGLPPPTPVLMGQLYQESGFNPNAKSRTGALGLPQFMPATAKWAATFIGDGSPTDPAWGIKAAAWYDRFLYERIDYPTDCERWGAALSSYNGGLGWLQKRERLAADPTDFWGSVRFVNPGISAGNQRENQEYPQRIIYKHQAQFVRLGDRKVCIP